MSSVRRNIKAGIGAHGIKDACNELVQAALAGLSDAAEYGLEKAKEQVPKEAGHLDETGIVTVDKAKQTAAVSFDGPYAVYQHELLHLKHIHGGNAKFLENALLDNREKFAEIIAAKMREVSGG
jgi:hypothetical protein